ncbi:MAG: 5-amino-6-(D-ribitylamino)uracil--L-tyrosine 4-hydroxyphenyl transferase CofH [Pseudomonadota bacterium]
MGSSPAEDSALQPDIARIVDTIVGGAALSEQQAYALDADLPLAALVEAAGHVRDVGRPNIVSYSPKVFLPLTFLCRDSCHYCTFAKAPRSLKSPYMSIEEMVAIARRGAEVGCREALFTLGDQPELRYRAARVALAALGHETTLSYVEAAARAVYEETGLLPHVNPGVMSAGSLASMRGVSVSGGLMLESASERLCQRGGPHFGSPDKVPAVRLATLREAGVQRIPFTTGILIGIGETRRERIESLLAIRALHAEYGHIQEIIVQNFAPKPGTRMANAPAPSLEEHLWTIAATRLIFGPAMSIQAPPNLQPSGLRQLIDAGINDWGGVSPVTPDHVNPEAPWPEVARLRAVTEAAGKTLVPRLAIYPEYIRDLPKWVAPNFHTAILRSIDSDGYAREDQWFSGAATTALPAETVRLLTSPAPRSVSALDKLLFRARDGAALTEAEITRLFEARGTEFTRVVAAADALRRQVNGDTVSYVINRNISYTNICYYKCTFCAFSKGQGSNDLRGAPYNLALDEIAGRVREARERGATEVCMQGGIHPSYTGETYLSICRTAKEAVPEIHIHAFSPLEIWQGAKTLGLPLRTYLEQLKAVGLATLPGTAAEILDEEIRKKICADKITGDEWREVIETAHSVGLRTTATIMFGHLEQPAHWARHLLAVRELQARTGGFTEFVPLPFVHMEAPMYRKGLARKGPTLREAILMHAVARLALHPLITNIQASWVKMGSEGVLACLQAGANDLGGTLMNEYISRSAGAAHGQEMLSTDMERMIVGIGRTARQRTTLYGEIPAGDAPLARRASA